MRCPNKEYDSVLSGAAKSLAALLKKAIMKNSTVIMALLGRAAKLLAALLKSVIMTVLNLIMALLAKCVI